MEFIPGNLKYIKMHRKIESTLKKICSIYSRAGARIIHKILDTPENEIKWKISIPSITKIEERAMNIKTKQKFTLRARTRHKALSPNPGISTSVSHRCSRATEHVYPKKKTPASLDGDEASCERVHFSLPDLSSNATRPSGCGRGTLAGLRRTNYFRPA